MLIKNTIKPRFTDTIITTVFFSQKKNVKVEKQELYEFLELKCLSSLSSIE